MMILLLYTTTIVTQSTMAPLSKVEDVVDEVIKKEHRMKLDGDLAENVRLAMEDKKRTFVLGEGVFGKVL